MTNITLYHNPHCSKSRQTLELLEQHGLSPEIVLYLETPPNAATLATIIEMLGVPAHDIVRTGEDEYDSAMVDWSDDQLLAAIEQHPKLMQRPIVVCNGKARIGRPPESVLEIVTQ